MMKRILSLLLALNACLTYGQSTPASDALDYFNRGVLAFQQNELIKADSMFTTSIFIQPTSDALYNRAVIRFILGDTCSACSDLGYIHVRIRDDSASKDYYRYCLNSYSGVYYDKKFQKIENPAEYIYYEEILYPKCESVANGIIHKKGHKSSVEFKSLNPVDVYATYLIIDSVKVFNFVFSSTFDADNRDMIDSFKGRLKQYLNGKYNFNEIPANRRYFKVVLIFNGEGAVISAIIRSGPFAVFDKTTRDVLESDIVNSLKQMPPIKPVKFLKTPVNFTYDLRIAF